jgi:hypothetical protein
MVMDSTLPEIREPNPATKKRMLEVDFYYMMRGLFEYTGMTKTAQGRDYMEALGNLAELERPMALIMLYNMMVDDKKKYKPNKMEAIITMRYKGLSYGKIRKLYGFSPNTITNAIREYDAKGQIGFAPKINDIPIHQEMYDILTKLRAIFAPTAKYCEVTFGGKEINGIRSAEEIE